MTLDRSINLLIVDDERDIRTILIDVLSETYNLKITEAGSGNEAIAILKKNPNPDYDAIICTLRMSDGTGKDLHQFVKKSGLIIPIVLIGSEEISSYPELNDPLIFAVSKKPDLKGLDVILLNILLDKINKDQKSSLKNVQIPVSFLQSYKKLPCDIYIALSDNKTVKVGSQFSSWSTEDNLKYSSKNVSNYVVRQKDYLKLVTRLTSNNPTFKTSLELLENIFPLLSGPYCAQDEIKLFVKNCASIAIADIKSKPALEHSLGRYFNHETIDSKLKTAATLHVAYSIMTRLGYGGEDNIKNLTYATLLRKSALPLDWLDLDQPLPTFNDQQKASYYAYPFYSAQIAQNILGNGQNLSALILQHREKIDGTGFPHKIKIQDINHLSLLLIMAQNIVNFAQENRTSNWGDFFSCEPEFLKSPTLPNLDQLMKPHYKYPLISIPQSISI